MIILRYLSRELLQTTFAVTLVLMAVIMSGRFVKYLADAASGKFDPSVLLAIMFYRLPGFLELILPLGFMVAILMAYGRLYAEQEMTVLFSCGISQKKLLGLSYFSAVLVAIIVGFCSLWLTPMGLQKAEQIIEQQKHRSEFETMKPGRFQVARSGKSVSYMERQLADKTLERVFIATMGVTKDEDVLTIKAGSAERVDSKEYQQRYLVLKNGVRYQGRPGDINYRVTEFDQFAEHIGQPKIIALSTDKVNSQPTAALFSMQAADAEAALQWRLSSPLLVLIITVLGVTMSHTTPRRGRYAMLFPSILLYLIYIVMLNAARGAVEEQKLSPAIGLWAVHGLFLFSAIMLFLMRSGMLRGWFKKAPVMVQAT
ncbi:MAG: LPS export ABC transporter permease LptF [Cellvibrionaceae bacterium]